jgi:hypothetical protein
MITKVKNNEVKARGEMEMIDKQKIYDRLNITPDQLANFCKRNPILSWRSWDLFGVMTLD